MEFNGPEYDPKLDRERLTSQYQRIFALMSDQVWRTLSEIEGHTHDPHSSISAQLRHMRKRRFGSHTVNRRRTGIPEAGLFEYQLIPTEPSEDRVSEEASVPAEAASAL